MPGSKLNGNNLLELTGDMAQSLSPVIGEPEPPGFCLQDLPALCEDDTNEGY